MDPTLSTVLDTRAAPMFHRFLELPVELQRQIWKFSLLTPRAIHFVRTPGYVLGCGIKISRNRRLKDFGRSLVRKISNKRRGVNRGHGVHDSSQMELLNKPDNHPLLYTCNASRVLALEIYGEPFQLSLGALPVADEHNLFWQAIFKVYLNPDVDTIFFPNFPSLSWFRIQCDLLRGNRVPYPRGREPLVRSLAIGDVSILQLLPDLEDYRSCIGPNAPVPFSVLEVDHWNITMIANFPDLEELIFVDPRVEDEDIDYFRVNDPGLWRDLLVMGEEEKIRRCVQVTEKDLKEDAAERGRVEGTIGQRSSWWDNPRVTCMTKEEFDSRFS